MFLQDIFGLTSHERDRTHVFGVYNIQSCESRIIFSPSKSANERIPALFGALLWVAAPNRWLNHVRSSEHRLSERWDFWEITVETFRKNVRGAVSKIYVPSS